MVPAMPVDLEKLRSVGFVGKTRGKSRVRRLEGGKAIEIDHPDGRVEAIVRPDTVRRTVSIKETGS